MSYPSLPLMTRHALETLIGIGLLILLAACGEEAAAERHETTGVICEWGKQKIDLCRHDTQEEMIDALLLEMNLDEKIGQMTQSVWHNKVSPTIVRDRKIGSIIHTEGPSPGPDVMDWIDKFNEFQKHALTTRLGIPLLIAVDAIHGQNTFDGAVIFPHNIGMAATRNLQLIKRAAEVTAIEVAGTGFNWTFSPCIAMPQHEHWGRVYEGYTEDLDLTTAAVIASVQGHQGLSLANRNTVAATAKHFIADGATDGGVEGGNASMTDQEMRDIYLPPYAAAVDQGVASVMVGFNSYNGVNMHQHTELVTGVLKGELGFEGVVVTDWDGGQRFGAAHTVINAGIDIAMQPGNHDEFMNDLKTSVLDQTVPMSRINDAVKRILQLKFELGLFVDPFAKKEFSNTVGSTQHRAVARQAVRESLVLLKSENGALPLSPSDKIVVVGAHGNNSGLQSGGWSIHWQGQTENYSGATTIFDGITSVSDNVEYAENGCYDGMAAEKAVVVVGENPYAEGEGDSDQLWLSDAHKSLIQGCKALGKKVITILISGRVLIIKPELDSSDAFIAAWLPGSEGNGVADFLFAIDGFKPKGKSPYSWPVDYKDIPLAPYAPNALFQFGYGLQDY
ncbi:MAG: glycoside hydrolase family 3 N-terminal domain-containing protein [Xanthomonadales bacterium]|nr:glycoside hydrolase family 3 N-terminal domain-containing protein [Xanthomonadales bacterium]